MENRPCFNCGESSHLSRACPYNQMYSRCPECTNVCFDADKHKHHCSNVDFRSAYLGNTESVVEWKTFLEMEYRLVNKVTVWTKRGEKDLTDLALFLPANSMQVKLINGWIQFDGIEKRGYTIVIIDKDDRRRLKLFISNSMIINEHYTVSQKGYIKYDRFAEQNVYGRADCMLKMYSDVDIFHIRAKWESMTYILDLYRDGAILKDPQETYFKRYQTLYENERASEMGMLNENDEQAAAEATEQNSDEQAKSVSIDKKDDEQPTVPKNDEEQAAEPKNDDEQATEPKNDDDD